MRSAGLLYLKMRNEIKITRAFRLGRFHSIPGAAVGCPALEYFDGYGSIYLVLDKHNRAIFKSGYHGGLSRYSLENSDDSIDPAGFLPALKAWKYKRGIDMPRISSLDVAALIYVIENL